MHFAPLTILTEHFRKILKRFPFEIFFAVLGTSTAVILIGKDTDADFFLVLLRVMMLAMLGFPLSLCTTLFLEGYTYQEPKKRISKLVIFLLGLSTFFVLHPLQVYVLAYTRFLLLFCSFHLAVSFAHFLRAGQMQGFWQFNKALFLRFLTALFYSSVLIAGIEAAAATSNLLFNLHLSGSFFGRIALVIIGLFSTLFFLAGVPENAKDMNEDFSYPKALKVFTQYVLIPLASLYLLILLIYEIKILMTWKLPNGQVSTLILAYAAFGILSLLLIYPIREESGHKWMRHFARGFYWLMLPLLILLFVAVGVRVLEYGITEERYVLIALSCWLLFISIHSLTVGSRNIKLIPISLCILGIFGAFGPLSAASVSAFSQKQKLVKIFKKYGAFSNGKLQFINAGKISRKEGTQAAAILKYLSDRYSLDGLTSTLPFSLSKLTDSIAKAQTDHVKGSFTERDVTEEYNVVKARLGLKKFNAYHDYQEGETASSYISISRSEDHILPISGYDLFIKNMIRLKDTSRYSSKKLSVQIEKSDLLYSIKVNQDSLRIDMKDMIKHFSEKLDKLTIYKDSSTQSDEMDTYILPADSLDFYKETSHYRFLLSINSLHFLFPLTFDPYSTNEVNFDLLIKAKPFIP